MRRAVPALLVLFCLGLAVTTTAQTKLDGPWIAGLRPGAERQTPLPVPWLPPGDTVYSFPAPGTWPGGLAWDGQYFWHCDLAARTVYKLDTAGVVDTSFPYPPNIPFGGGMEWDGSLVWIVAEERGKVFKFDPTTFVFVDSFSLPDSASPDPNSWGLAWDGTYMWHSQYGSQARIFKIDPTNGQVLHSLPAPASGVLGITWDDAYLCCASIDRNMLYRVNAPDSSIVDSTQWQVPHPMGLVWTSPHFWNVSSQTNRIYRIDGLTGIGEQEPGPAGQAKRLHACGPNPFFRSTSVRYACTSELTELLIADAQGRTVRRLVPGISCAGTHAVFWDGTDDAGTPVPAGLYVLCLRTSGLAPESAPVVLLR